LERWDTLHYPSLSLWAYFEQTGQERACFDLACRAAEKSDAPVFAYQYALVLYRRSQFAEALAVLDRRKGNAFAGDYLRVCILAELHPKEHKFARKAYEEMAKRYSILDAGQHYRQQLLWLMGHKEEAGAVSRTLRRQNPGSNPNLDYFCGDISEDEYLKVVERGKWGRCMAHYNIALKRLAEGDQAGAREHFRQAVQTRLILNYVGHWSRRFLARMEEDPNWPPWIPVKK
jgi:hypothetical protein